MSAVYQQIRAEYYDRNQLYRINLLIRSLPRVIYVRHSDSFRELDVTYVVC